MTEKELDPYVRFFTRNRKKIPYPRAVMAYDHRLFYVRRGNIELELEDDRTVMRAGSLWVLPPKTPYRLHVDEADIDYIIINFDFDSAASGTRAIAPVCREQFHEALVFSCAYMEPFGAPVFLRKAFFAEPFLDEMERVKGENGAFCGERLSALVKYILLAVADSMVQNKEKDHPLVAKAKAFVDAHYAERIGNQSVAKALGYHPYYLNARFGESTGMTLHHYIEQVRLGHAKRLLIESAAPIRDIAQDCGFVDPAYFSKFFWRHTGMLPKDYRDFSH